MLSKDVQFDFETKIENKNLNPMKQGEISNTETNGK